MINNTTILTGRIYKIDSKKNLLHLIVNNIIIPIHYNSVTFSNISIELNVNDLIGSKGYIATDNNTIHIELLSYKKFNTK